MELPKLDFYVGQALFAQFERAADGLAQTWINMLSRSLYNRSVMKKNDECTAVERRAKSGSGCGEMQSCCSRQVDDPGMTLARLDFPNLQAMMSTTPLL